MFLTIKKITKLKITLSFLLLIDLTTIQCNPPLKTQKKESEKKSSSNKHLAIYVVAGTGLTILTSVALYYKFFANKQDSNKTEEKNKKKKRKNLVLKDLGKIGNCKITLLQDGNIVDQFKNTENAAIVNAANEGLRGGSGIDGAIHDAAGPELLEELRNKYPLGGKTGKAYPTGGGNLSPTKIIHAIGPRGTNKNKEKLLKNVYDEIMNLTQKENIQFIAVPSISTGIFAYNIQQAAPIAIKTISDFVKKNPDAINEIRFVIWSDESTKIYENEISKYLSH